MRQFRVCLLAFCVFDAAAMAAPATRPISTPIAPPASYVELYRQILDAPAKGRKGNFGDTLATANVSLRLYLRTGDSTFKDQAVKLFDAGLSAPDFSLKDFHVLHHFGEMVFLLKRENLLTPLQRQKLNAVAAAELKNLLKSSDDGDYNIRIGQFTGCARLLRYLDGESFAERAAVQARIDSYWEKIKQVGDLDEDASNYDSLGIAFLLDLARLLDREQDLRGSAYFRRMFDRQRDIVSPSGLIPEYGDSYFHYDACPMDRIYVLESAARIYNDPTFLYGARKIYQRPQAALPQADYWIRSLQLINMELMAEVPRAPQGPASQVSYRARRGEGAALVDKVILRTGMEPGSAMAMFDLYASGSHSHPEKGPSIAYFEADSVPLFHNLGRHGTRSAITGNILWMLPGNEAFPGDWTTSNNWITMTIPVDHLTQQDGKCVVAPSLSLRNFQERSRACQYLFFDNLRLEGAAGIRLVDGFEDTTGWDPRLVKITSPINSTDKTQGNFSQRLEWKDVPSAEYRRKFSVEPIPPFTPDQYECLKLDLKYVGASKPYMHIRGLGEQMDLGDHMLPSQLAQATVEQRGRDAYARIEYKSYIRSDTRLVRQIVLTAEGCLVVRDVVTPGPSADGYNAGQLWQLYDLKDKGENWFCADDDGEYPSGAPDAAAKRHVRRMLVRFAPAPNASAGVHEIKQPYSCANPRQRPAERFFTTFTQHRLAAGRKESFAFVVLPHDPQTGDPASVAGRIRVTDSSTGATATLQTPAGNVEVRISDDSWEVRR
jgi:hypothetical protein